MYWNDKKDKVLREFWRNRLISFYSAILDGHDLKINRLFKKIANECVEDSRFLHYIMPPGRVFLDKSDLLLFYLDNIVPLGIGFTLYQEVSGIFAVVISKIEDTQEVKNRLFALHYGDSLEKVLR